MQVFVFVHSVCVYLLIWLIKLLYVVLTESYGTKCVLFITLCTFHSYPQPFLGLVGSEKSGVMVRPLTYNMSRKRVLRVHVILYCMYSAPT